uniref:SJCHGC09231 protein n=1 Tax=Schistosoma japonicum TaxID=6182 RepID=Q5DE46_SCHJA|nr:SJCHGC09231 protein [Schistosoma japonicum]
MDKTCITNSEVPKTGIWEGDIVMAQIRMILIMVEEIMVVGTKDNMGHTHIGVIILAVQVPMKEGETDSGARKFVLLVIVIFFLEIFRQSYITLSIIRMKPKNGLNKIVMCLLHISSICLLIFL